MGNIVLIAPEDISARMAGGGVRYLEMSRALSRAHQVTLLGRGGDTLPVDGVTVKSYARQSFASLCEGADAVVLHGHISKRYFKEVRDKPTAVDLYDPFLIENLHYKPVLGEGVYHHDHDVLDEQLRLGDFFLCSTPQQRLFYLGMLFSLGRVAPDDFLNDRDLEDLIAVVPFGTSLSPDSGPSSPWRESIEGLEPSDKVIFFGGIYDWYDPFTLIKAMERIDGQGALKAVFSFNPNRETTPQRNFEEVREYCDAKGWTGKRVFFVDWLAHDRVIDIYASCDLAVLTTSGGLEGELSFRTRLLDYLAAGLPAIVTEGGWLTDRLATLQAVRTVPTGDHEALARQILLLLDQAPEREEQIARGKRAVEAFRWEKAVAPLEKFLEHPRLSPTRIRRDPPWGLSGFFRKLMKGRRSP